VTAISEKPERPTPLPDRPGHALASMGIYVFNADFLIEQLERDAANPQSSHDFGKDIIPALVGSARVFAHRFGRSSVNRVGDQPYWRDVVLPDGFQAGRDPAAERARFEVSERGITLATRDMLARP